MLGVRRLRRSSMSYAVLVNGRGNAWPIEVGAPCGPGSRSAALGNDLREYANTSFSIVRESAVGNLEWSVLVDVGMGVIPALVQSSNRLPDAIVLTHSHLDHIAGLDWLIANNGRYGKGPLPVYASEACYNEVFARFPWLAYGHGVQSFLSRSVRRGRHGPWPASKGPAGVSWRLRARGLHGTGDVRRRTNSWQRNKSVASPRPVTSKPCPCGRGDSR
jgi:glyoxylase-like metal-dependent hydrolase (beta-lactamase superfamily II)